MDGRSRHNMGQASEVKGRKGDLGNTLATALLSGLVCLAMTLPHQYWLLELALSCQTRDY